MTGNDLGTLLSGLVGGDGQSGGAGNLLAALLGAFGNGQGGGGGNPLAELLDTLTKSGLADQAQSWVGTGENKAVSGAEIAKALPDEALRKAAEQAGLSPEHAADKIARALPFAVDRLSPSGEVPEGSLEDLIRNSNR